MWILNKNKVSYLSIVIILFLLGVMTICKKSARKLNENVVALFITNGIIWFYILVLEIKKSAFSLKIMHWFFAFIFFSLAPLVQYYLGIFPWIGKRTDDVLIRANILLVIWTAAVLAGTKIGKSSDKKRIKKVSVKKITGWKGYDKILPCLTIFNLINMCYRIYNVGFTNLLSRGTNSGVSFSDYGSLSMLIGKIIEGIVYFSVSISIIYYSYRIKNGRSLGYLAINSVCLLVSYFPTGLARYAAAVIYMGLMLTCFNGFKKNRYFIIIFIMAFTIILPFLNSFREASFSDVDLLKVFSDALFNIIDNWKNVDYDAYTQFTLTIEYVDLHGAGGNHLLSDLLFWVPRSIWPTKAFSGSYEIAHERGLFDNVSFPFPAIGYMDGGIIGMILFGNLIGFTMEKLDRQYWKYIDTSGRRIQAFDILYPVIVIYWFFMCRGDIFFTFAYLVGYVIAWFLIVKCIK